MSTLTCFWTVAQGFDCIHLIMARIKVRKYQGILDVASVICMLFEEQERFQPLLSNNTDNNSDYISPAGRVRKDPWEGFSSQVEPVICWPPELRDSRSSSCWHPARIRCVRTLDRDFYSINTDRIHHRQDPSQLSRLLSPLSLFLHKDIKTECWHDVSDSDR